MRRRRLRIGFILPGGFNGKGRSFHQRIEIDASLDETGQRIHPLPVERGFIGGDKPEMPFGNSCKLLLWNPPQHGDIRKTGRHGFLEIFQVARSPDAIENDPGQFEIPVEIPETVDEGRGAPGHAARIDNQDHGNAQPFCHFGAASRFSRPVVPVIEAHDPLDNGRIRAGKQLPEKPLVGSAAEHPAVEVTGAASGHQGMKSRIDEIRAHLEGLDPKASRPEGRP